MVVGAAIGISSVSVYKGWRAVCPDCDKLISPSMYGRRVGTKTRKQAKDVLYLHRKAKDRIFGCRGKSTPAVAGGESAVVA